MWTVEGGDRSAHIHHAERAPTPLVMWAISKQMDSRSLHARNHRGFDHQVRSLKPTENPPARRPLNRGDDNPAQATPTDSIHGHLVIAVEDVKRAGHAQMGVR